MTWRGDRKWRTLGGKIGHDSDIASQKHPHQHIERDCVLVATVVVPMCIASSLQGTCGTWGMWSVSLSLYHSFVLRVDTDLSTHTHTHATQGSVMLQRMLTAQRMVEEAILEKKKRKKFPGFSPIFSSRTWRKGPRNVYCMPLLPPT